MQQPQMIVHFTKRYANYVKGDQANFPKPLADQLVAQGYGSLVRKVEEPEPPPPPARK